MALRTRLTEMLRIEHPIISAPMAFAAGGKLAAAVTTAGGLGLRHTLALVLCDNLCQRSALGNHPAQDISEGRGL